MSSCSWTDIVTAAAAIVTACAAAYAAWLAKSASDTWRRTLENQSVDECVSAVHELQSAINRVIALMEAGSPRDSVVDAYTEAWKLSWRRFDQAYAIAKRYHPGLPDDSRQRFEGLLSVLHDQYLATYSGGIISIPQGFGGLKDNTAQLAQTVEAELLKAPPKGW
jgi:hypothetical protein